MYLASVINCTLQVIFLIGCFSFSASGRLASLSRDVGHWHLFFVVGLKFLMVNVPFPPPPLKVHFVSVEVLKDLTESFPSHVL